MERRTKHGIQNSEVWPVSVIGSAISAGRTNVLLQNAARTRMEMNYTVFGHRVFMTCVLLCVSIQIRKIYSERKQSGNFSYMSVTIRLHGITLKKTVLFVVTAIGLNPKSRNNAVLQRIVLRCRSLQLLSGGQKYYIYIYMYIYLPIFIIIICHYCTKVTTMVAGRLLGLRVRTLTVACLLWILCVVR